MWYEAIYGKALKHLNSKYDGAKAQAKYVRVTQRIVVKLLQDQRKRNALIMKSKYFVTFKKVK